jgi:hypothetical protein
MLTERLRYTIYNTLRISCSQYFTTSLCGTNHFLSPLLLLAMSWLIFPQELFDGILSHIVYHHDAMRDCTRIEGTKLRPLRLVSRRFYELTENTFIDANVSVRKVDITTGSLRTLQSILGHRNGYYGRSIRKLVICRDQLTYDRYENLKSGKYDVYSDDGMRYESVHAQHLAELDSYEADKTDRLDLEQSGRGQRILSQAFQQMPYLQEIEIDVPLQHSRGAWYATEQRSPVETGVLCEMVLAALRNSDIKLEAFLVGSRASRKGSYDTPHGFSPLDSNAFASKTFDAMRKLTLPLALLGEDSEQNARYDSEKGEKEAKELPQYWLDFVNRILHFPLQELDLCWDTAESFGFANANDILSRLCNSWGGTLTHLTLSTLTLHASTLQSFVSLTQHGRLKNIALRYINVGQGSWLDVIKSLRDSLTSDHEVQLLDLYHLGQGSMRVGFYDQDLGREQFSWLYYQGGELEDELDGMLRDMRITRQDWVVGKPWDISTWGCK